MGEMMKGVHIWTPRSPFFVGVRAPSTSGLSFAVREVNGVQLRAYGRNSATPGWGYYGQNAFALPSLLNVPTGIVEAYTFQTLARWLPVSGSPLGALGWLNLTAGSGVGLESLTGAHFVVESPDNTWRARLAETDDANSPATALLDFDTEVDATDVVHLAVKVIPQRRRIEWLVDGGLVASYDYGDMLAGRGGSGVYYAVGSDAAVSTNAEIDASTAAGSSGLFFS